MTGHNAPDRPLPAGTCCECNHAAGCGCDCCPYPLPALTAATALDGS